MTSVRMIELRQDPRKSCFDLKKNKEDLDQKENVKNKYQSARCVTSALLYRVIFMRRKKSYKLKKTNTELKVLLKKNVYVTAEIHNVKQ